MNHERRKIIATVQLVLDEERAVLETLVEEEEAHLENMSEDLHSGVCGSHAANALARLQDAVSDLELIHETLDAASDRYAI